MTVHRYMVAALAVALLAGCGAPAVAAGVESVAVAAAPSGVAAAAALGELPVKGRAAKTGYSRSQFGQAWKDTDRNGCDQRNDVLARDLVDEVLRGRCVVLAGTLHSAYTGETVPFVRGQGTSADVQVDHVVSLSNAWQTGAQALSSAEREQLGNDLLNLVAVEGPINQAKSDGDAATWLPPAKSARCSYVARQIAVKQRYRLWVTSSERDAMARVLNACPGEQLPT